MFEEWKRNLLPTKEEIELLSKIPEDQISPEMALDLWVKGCIIERAMLGLPLANVEFVNEDGERCMFEVRISTAELMAWGYFDGSPLDVDVGTEEVDA